MKKYQLIKNSLNRYSILNNGYVSFSAVQDNEIIYFCSSFRELLDSLSNDSSSDSTILKNNGFFVPHDYEVLFEFNAIEDLLNHYPEYLV